MKKSQSLRTTVSTIQRNTSFQTNVVTVLDINKGAELSSKKSLFR